VAGDDESSGDASPTDEIVQMMMMCNIEDDGRVESGKKRRSSVRKAPSRTNKKSKGIDDDDEDEDESSTSKTDGDGGRSGGGTEEGSGLKDEEGGGCLDCPLHCPRLMPVDGMSIDELTNMINQDMAILKQVANRINVASTMRDCLLAQPAADLTIHDVILLPNVIAEMPEKGEEEYMKLCDMMRMAKKTAEKLWILQNSLPFPIFQSGQMVGSTILHKEAPPEVAENCKRVYSYYKKYRKVLHDGYFFDGNERCYCNIYKTFLVRLSFWVPPEEEKKLKQKGCKPRPEDYLFEGIVEFWLNSLRTNRKVKYVQADFVGADNVTLSDRVGSKHHAVELLPYSVEEPAAATQPVPNTKSGLLSKVSSTFTVNEGLK